jgi:hypothetical protein
MSACQKKTNEFHFIFMGGKKEKKHVTHMECGFIVSFGCYMLLSFGRNHQYQISCSQKDTLLKAGNDALY